MKKFVADICYIDSVGPLYEIIYILSKSFWIKVFQQAASTDFTVLQFKVWK